MLPKFNLFPLSCPGYIWNGPEADMRYLRLCLVFLAASGLTMAGDGSDRDKSGGADRAASDATRPVLPRVLRDSEPADSVLVRLPGPPAPQPVIPPPPPPAAVQVVAKAVEPPARHDAPPVSLEDPGRPILKRAPKPVYPPDFERDSATYCQKLINQWSVEDAGMLLGDPHASRPAYDNRQKENGTIYAFSDPTGHYRQLELDFDGETGTLRTVFGYPWNLTWQECRHLWGANVSSAEANKGRKFYSYLNRRLDVLVDPNGKVISLGLY